MNSLLSKIDSERNSIFLSIITFGNFTPVKILKTNLREKKINSAKNTFKAKNNIEKIYIS